MKRGIMIAVVLFSATMGLSAQELPKSIINKETHLLVNDSIAINKGGIIQIYLPAGKEFIFVKQKKSKLSAKLLGDVAGMVGTGAAAVGLGSNNLGVLQKSIQVMNTANAVQYGADAIEKINDLPISKNAKKIAGQKMKVLSWEFTEDGWVITAEYNRKKYEIFLQDAIAVGEVKL